MLVRSDLTAAQQFVQACHAAHEAGIFFGNPDHISSLVLCTVPDEAALRDASRRLQLRGIRFSLFQEPDMENQATALATEPIPGPLRKVFSKYPLWKELKEIQHEHA